MKTTGISTLDHAPQVVAEWLNFLCEDLGWSEKSRAYMLLRETLHAIRDFLTVEEAADLAAQLPLLVRGIYYDGWVPSRTPAHARNKEDFLERISKPFHEGLADPERAVVAVLDLLRRNIDFGEFHHVAQSMRKSLRELWL